MIRYPLLGVLIIVLLASMACSSDKAPTNPALNAGNQQDIGAGHNIWGSFDVTFNKADGTAKIEWNRAAEKHWNVTNFIKPPNCFDCVSVTSTSYDPVQKRFYVEVGFKNPTNFIGYDVRAVISNPGGNKVLLNADGITEVWGSPMQYRAINVDAERTFGPQEYHGRVFDFYLPGGENFTTLTYLVDASAPSYVTEPIIENGSAPLLINNGFATTRLTAKIWDHQGDLVPSQVSADLTPLGLSPITPMYDDGAHGDGAAGDGTFGTNEFSTTAGSAYYMVNIYAIDAQANFGWGQGMIPVQGGTNPGNDNPVINSVTTSKTTAKSPEKILITVNATDPDGDPIDFQFEASDGSFSGPNENTTQWKPGSQTGKQTILITVVDDKGGSAGTEINLWSTTLSPVSPGNMPSASLSSFSPSKNLKFPDDMLGNVTYMNWWATWCGPCVAEMPHLQNMYNKYKSNDEYIHMFLLVSDTISKATNFINSNGYTATYWVDDISGSYFGACGSFVGGSNGIPRHLIFDRDGVCRYAAVGSQSSTANLENAINQLL